MHVFVTRSLASRGLLFQREARLRADVALPDSACARPFELRDGSDCSATFERDETSNARAL